MLHRLATLAVSLPLCLALTDVHAAPGKPPKAKALPIPAGLQPISDVRPQLDPGIAKALKEKNMLSKQQVVAIAGRFRIDAQPNDVLQPTSLTVRRPYSGPGAFMSFPFTDAVHPEAHTDGVATIDSAVGFVRRVFEPGTIAGVYETLDELNRNLDPLNPAFPEGADATVTGRYLHLHLLAAENRDYVVSCRVDSGHFLQVDFGALVEVDGAYSHMVRDLIPSNGRISFAIPRSTSRRSIDVRLLGYRKVTAGDSFSALVAGSHILQRFSVSRCDITPIE